MDMGSYPDKAPKDLCEEGVGMVAQGIYKEAETNGNLERAEQYAETAISVLQGTLNDIRGRMSDMQAEFDEQQHQEEMRELERIEMENHFNKYPHG